ncbi:MAG: hypothetical protein ACI9DF_004545 [Verrucomicrobiales bacterium]|jgi:hypothetical protein
MKTSDRIFKLSDTLESESSGPLAQADGYLALNMPEEAWNALEEVPTAHEADEPFLLKRVEIAIQWEKWELGVMIANGALMLHPGGLDSYIAGAYCVRRYKSLEAAYEYLSKAEQDCVQLSPLWCYRMACYESLLGHFDAVGAHLAKAVLFDEDLKNQSVADEDLRAWFDLA